MNTLDDRLEDIFETVFQRRVAITDETTASNIPEWDSLAHINLMFAIEQEFGIQFPGNRFAEFQTMGELKEYLRAKGAA